MRRSLLVMILLTLVVCSLLFAACGGEDYSVTFVIDGKDVVVNDVSYRGGISAEQIPVNTQKVVAKEFAYWTYESDGQIKALEAGDKFKSGQRIELTAYFEAKLNLVASVGKAGTVYDFDGVVFATGDGGFFANDESGAVFVESATAVQVGQTVRISGKLAVVQNAPRMTNATVVAANGEFAARVAQTRTLANLYTLTQARRNFYQYFNSFGTVSKTDDVYSVSYGEDSLLFASTADAALLDPFVGQKVDFTAVTTGSNGSEFFAELKGGTNSVKPYALNVASVKDDVFAHVATVVPTNVYVELPLPTSYEQEPDLAFTWSAPSGSPVSVTDNVATVSSVDRDVLVELTLTLSSGSQSQSKNFAVTVKYAQPVAFADVSSRQGLLAVEGTLVARGVDTEKTYLRVLLADQDGNLAHFDLPSGKYEEWKALQTGCKLRLIGDFASTSISSAFVVVQEAPTDFALDFEAMDPVSLSTYEEIEAFNATAPSERNDKLYKIESPWLIYSGTASYNYVRYGATPVQAKENQTGFIIASLVETVPTFFDTFDVPLNNAGAKQYPGYVVYAFAVFEYAPFVVPCADAIVFDTASSVIKEITGMIAPVYDASRNGTIAFPAQTESGSNIVYSTEYDGLNAETGEYVKVDEDVEVTIVATFVASDGNVRSGSFTLLLSAEAFPDKTVTQLLEGADGYVPSIVAYFATVATIPGGSDYKDFREGIILTDGANVVCRIDKEYGLDGRNFLPGDKLRLSGATYSSGKLSGGTLELLEATSGDRPDYAELKAKAVVVSSDKQLAAFTEATTPGGIYVVTFKAPFSFVGSAANATTCRYQLNYKNAKSSDKARYTWANAGEYNTKAFSFSVSALNTVFPQWYADFGLPAYSSATCLKVDSGEITAVSCSYGNTYYAWSIIDYVASDSVVEQEIVGSVPSRIDALESGAITLPTETKNAKNIAWTCDNDAVFNAVTGAYSAVEQDVSFTLTAYYKFNGQTKTVDVSVTLVGDSTTMSLSQAMAQENGSVVKLYAYVAAFATNTQTTKDLAQTEYYNGLILTDGKLAVWYQTDQFAVDQTSIEVRDRVTVSDVTVNRDASQNVCNLSGGEVVSIGTKAETLDYSQLAIDATFDSTGEGGVAAANQALEAWAASKPKTGNYVIKLKGNVGFGFSDTNAARVSTRMRAAFNTLTGQGRGYAWSGMDEGAVSAIAILVSASQKAFPNFRSTLGITDKVNTSGHYYTVDCELILVSTSYSASYFMFSVIDVKGNASTWTDHTA